MSSSCLIIPMYNEEKNVKPLISQIGKMINFKKGEFDILIVNDGSNDQTGNILKKMQKKYRNLIVLEHSKNQGIGQALQTGIKQAIKLGYQTTVFMEADLTNNPRDIPRFLTKLDEGYDLVLGSRFIPTGGMVKVNFWRAQISQLGNLFGRYFLKIPISDLTLGFRAAKIPVFKKIQLKEKGFGIQLEMAVKAFWANFKIAELPVILGNRKYGKSNFKYTFSVLAEYLRLIIKLRGLRNA